MYYTLTWDIDSGGCCACAGAGGRWEVSVLSSFFLEPTIALKNDLLRKFPGDPVVRTLALSLLGPWVQSLVRELKSHKPHLFLDCGSCFLYPDVLI